jgi:hypothetical protein
MKQAAQTGVPSEPTELTQATATPTPAHTM